jgi:serine O-acetyltransferase
MALFQTIREDIQSVFDRDPAARSVLEILVCYPGLHAVWGHRLSRWFWSHNLKLIARFVSQVMRWLTGIEIHPGARIGHQFFIDHGMGVVIGETAEIGDCVTLYHGDPGGRLIEASAIPRSKQRGGWGAKVLGAIMGRQCIANARVKTVPPNSVVVGVPGEVVLRSKPRSLESPDLNHGVLPDVIGDTLVTVMARVEALEERLAGHEEHPPPVHMPDHGVWRGEDFSI